MRRLLLLIVLLGLCGIVVYRAKQKNSAPQTVATQSGAPTAAPSRGTFDPTTHVAVVHAKDFAFEAPDSITVGWTSFHLMNDGPSLHHIQLVRLDSGKTVADLGAAMKNPGPPPRWAVLVGGPNAPNPGAESDATVNLAAGQYALICLVDIPDNVPHVAKGMFHPLTVTAAAGPALAEPTADVTVGLADYSFAVSTSLKAGAHTIKVVNGGPQLHEVEIVEFAPGKTLADLNAWMAKPQGPPPANAIGGTSMLVPGMSIYVSMNLSPGKYAMLCFVPDAKDGKRHVEHGMVKEFTVN